MVAWDLFIPVVMFRVIIQPNLIYPRLDYTYGIEIFVIRHIIQLTITLKTNALYPALYVVIYTSVTSSSSYEQKQKISAEEGMLLCVLQHQSVSRNVPFEYYHQLQLIATSRNCGMQQRKKDLSWCCSATICEKHFARQKYRMVVSAQSLVQFISSNYPQSVQGDTVSKG